MYPVKCKLKEDGLCEGYTGNPALELWGCLCCRVDAGKVELDGAQYLGFNLPFSISQLLWIEALLVGGAEIYRNRSTDPQERLYPGVLVIQSLLQLHPHLDECTVHTMQQLDLSDTRCASANNAGSTPCSAAAHA